MRAALDDPRADVSAPDSSMAAIAKYWRILKPLFDHQVAYMKAIEDHPRFKALLAQHTN